jgi:N-acetylglutamate synthase-like GNAT family acetyltransferase
LSQISSACPTRAAADSASRACSAARSGYVLGLELMGSTGSPQCPGRLRRATPDDEVAMIRTRKAYADKMGRIAAFYRTNEYGPAIKPTDVIVIAENDGELCGAVRLCEENDRLVLRGMRVSERMRRRGIGTQLLEAAELLIGGRECLCVPHRHLQSFYGRIGFMVIDESEAPSFLQARWAEYRDKYGLDVIIMCRPSEREMQWLDGVAAQHAL